MTKENLIFLQEFIDVVSVSEKLRSIKKKEYENCPCKASNHYEFLYLLTHAMKPKLVVELGTYKGVSMLYMMEGYPKANFFTIDINVESGLYLKDKNVTCIFGDSARCADQIPNDIDVLFEDTNHKYNTLEREFRAYYPKMRRDGVMIFDDMNYELSPEAKEWWEDLRYPTKINLSKVHLGYGMTAIIKNS